MRKHRPPVCGCQRDHPRRNTGSWRWAAAWRWCHSNRCWYPGWGTCLALHKFQTLPKPVPPTATATATSSVAKKCFSFTFTVLLMLLLWGFKLHALSFSAKKKKKSSLSIDSFNIYIYRLIERETETQRQTETDRDRDWDRHIWHVTIEVHSDMRSLSLYVQTIQTYHLHHKLKTSPDTIIIITEPQRLKYKLMNTVFFPSNLPFFFFPLIKGL